MSTRFLHSELLQKSLTQKFHSAGERWRHECHYKLHYSRYFYIVEPHPCCVTGLRIVKRNIIFINNITFVTIRKVLIYVRKKKKKYQVLVFLREN